LFLSPGGEKSVTEPINAQADSTKKTVTVPSDEFVSIQLQWLPDFAEEYAIDIRSGLGVNETELTLENGWNLTSLNTKLDSQTDENITAFANLLDSVGSLPGIERAATPSEAGGAQRIVVRATNVPLGYYESVIGCDECGHKQLFGWRYVGFMPFNGCPSRATGSSHHCCHTADLYGLVFDSGIMTFKRLCEVQQIEQNLNYVYRRNPTQLTGKPQTSSREALNPSMLESQGPVFEHVYAD